MHMAYKDRPSAEVGNSHEYMALGPVCAPHVELQRNTDYGPITEIIHDTKHEASGAGHDSNDCCYKRHRAHACP